MRVLMFLMLSMLLCGSTYAANVVTLLSAETVSTNETVYSSSFNARNMSGYTAVVIDIGTGAGAAGFTVAQQCSIDGTTWYDPVDASGNALGAVYTSATSDKYVAYSPVLTPKIRFKVTAGATEDTVTLRYIWRER